MLRALASGTEREITYKGEVDLVTEIVEEAKGVIREELLGAFPLPTGCWPRRRRARGRGGRPLDRGPLGRDH